MPTQDSKRCRHCSLLSVHIRRGTFVDTPSFLELGEIYDLQKLKQMAEAEMLVQLDKKTKVRFVEIGEIFRAEKLFEAALKMTKNNVS